MPIGELMSLAEFEKRRADDPLYRAVTNLTVGHKTDCLFFRAVACAVAIECEHGYDVCPQCDPCTCGKGVSND